MADLKVDLVNKLNNDKFYAELELVRLAQEPNMNYKEKIGLMDGFLQELALLNGKLGLVEQYFKAPEPQAPPQPQTDVTKTGDAVPQGKVHQGQSHGE